VIPFAEAWLGAIREPIVLASASPRRRELLEGMGVAGEVVPSSVEETLDPGAGPEAEAVRLATEKGVEVVGRVGADRVVIAADTVVSVDGALLGKPADRHEARRCLNTLSGRAHDVITGVFVAHRGRTRTAFARTVVQFTILPPAVIEAYVSTDEPYDKAGGYGAQARGRAFIRGVDGCFFNVMGLPVTLTLDLLRSLLTDAA
jgi:septum formation protein